MNRTTPNIVILNALSRLGAKSMNVPPGIDEPTEEDYNTRIQADNKPTWDAFQTEFAAARQRKGDNLLRDFRAAVLASTDWIMAGDHIDLLENKAEWLAFRQSLRDLPNASLGYVFIPGMQRLNIYNMNLPAVPPLKRTGMDTKYFTIGFSGQLVSVQPPVTT